MKRSLRFASLGMLLLAFGLSAPLSAQDLDQRWTAWLGCWKAADSGSTVDDRGGLVCVVPAGESGVMVATVDGDEIVSRDTIRVTGEYLTTTRGGCTGQESA